MTADERIPTSADDPDGRQPVPVSRVVIVSYALVAVLLLGWFLFGWLVLRQGLVDSVSEALGAAFALLFGVSVVGTVRRSRRGPDDL